MKEIALSYTGIALQKAGMFTELALHDQVLYEYSIACLYKYPPLVNKIFGDLK